MTNRIAPTIVMEIERHPEPDLAFGFHTLKPSEAGWHVHPLGKRQPAYSRNATLHSPATAREQRDEMTSEGYECLVWDQLPEYLQAYLIGQEVPLEWKTALGVGNPARTSKVWVWVKGTLPADRPVSTEEEMRALWQKVAVR